ncbi:IctB family putative bicarbonate transporter [Baaleninema sp.]|uniref:IctB family putative bicarbonate transporter n=1 Tax=Baaleninema sp. TaxID=3101197 RepID=UPI003CFBF051
MASIWNQVTFANWSPQAWQGSSYLYRLLFGSLQHWRSSSWLMQQAELLGAALLSILFALAPFVSTTLIGVLLVACAAFLLLLLLSDDARIGITPIHLLVGLYWCVATIATTVSPVRQAAFNGWVKLTLYLLLFALCARVLRLRKLRNWVIGVYLHVALAVSVYGLHQYRVGVEPLATWTDTSSTTAEATRIYSYLGNPNLLAGYLIPAVAFSIAAVFVWQRWTAKALAVTMVAVNSAALVLTLSRGGWIGFVAALFVFALFVVNWWIDRLPQRWRKWAIPSVLAASVLVVLLAVVSVPTLRDRAASIFAGREDSSNNFRINVWAAVVDMIRDRPLIGIGPGNDAFNKIYPLFMRPKYTALSAYSVLLEIAVETGFIGLFCFLWLLLVTVDRGIVEIQRLRQTRDRSAFWLMASLSAMAGFMAHGLFDTVWYRPQINILWWLSVAIVASFYSESKQLEQET